MSTLEWLPVSIGLIAVGSGLLGLLLTSVERIRHNYPRLLRGSLLYFVAGLLLLVPAASFITRPSELEESALPVERSVEDEPEHATLTLLSDPAYADVLVDDIIVGRTPFEITLPLGSTLVYEVRAGDGVENPEGYEAFQGTHDAVEDVSVSVWLNRKE